MRSLLALAAVLAGPAFAADYTITLTHHLDEEPLARILVLDAGAEALVYDGDYVTPAGEELALMGKADAILAAAGGAAATVFRGTAGVEGFLTLGGRSASTDFSSGAEEVLVVSMIYPRYHPDHIVAARVTLPGPGETLTIPLDRYDIGHDEERRRIEKVAEAASSVTVIRR